MLASDLRMNAMNRRKRRSRPLPIAAAAGLMLAALAGCSKPPAPNAATPTPSPAPTSAPISVQTPSHHIPEAPRTTPQPAPPGEHELVLYCWTEYVPQAIISEFTKETGIRVRVLNYSSNEEMFDNLKTGASYDLVQPSEDIVEGLIRHGWLLPIDHGAIPNLRNVLPQFLNLPTDPGNRYTVPYMAGTVGIVVNTDFVHDDIRSYNDVFQDKYRNNIVVLDDPREIVSWAMASLGLPINDVSDESLAKIKPVLARWLPLVKTFDSDSPKTEMINGDAVLGIVWSGEGAFLLAHDKKFKWIAPADGAHMFVDSLAIPITARHRQNAEAFMNFILRPDISRQISDSFPYLNPNGSARSLLTDLQRSNPASYPSPADLGKAALFRDIGDQLPKLEEIVTLSRIDQAAGKKDKDILKEENLKY
jgi:spermidine/putrescine transport system permease protein